MCLIRTIYISTIKKGKKGKYHDFNNLITLNKFDTCFKLIYFIKVYTSTTTLKLKKEEEDLEEVKLIYITKKIFFVINRIYFERNINRQIYIYIFDILYCSFNLNMY